MVLLREFYTLHSPLCCTADATVALAARVVDTLAFPVADRGTATVARK